MSAHDLARVSNRVPIRSGVVMSSLCAESHELLLPGHFTITRWRLSLQLPQVYARTFLALQLVSLLLNLKLQGTPVH